MKCKYCGKWAGFFKTAHPECIENHKQAEARIQTTLTEKKVQGNSKQPSAPPESAIEGQSIEYHFLKCAEEFNKARELWHTYMDTLIREYGMPTLYVGCVNYMHDSAYNYMTVIKEIKELSETEKSIRLQNEIDYLKKWKFPGAYSVALFIYGSVINICGEVYKIDRIRSYSTYKIGGKVIYSIKINYVGFKDISIPCDDVRSNIEMKALLDACIKLSSGRTTYKCDGEVDAYLESNIDESIIKFEGISLVHPIKECFYALSNLNGEEKSISVIDINPNLLKLKNICKGYPINWKFYTSGNGLVYDTLIGETENFRGYTKTREAYDKLVAYYTSIFGTPTDRDDVPTNLRKNSIFKLLREDDYSIETKYIKDDICVTIDLEVNDEEGEKRFGHVNLYIKDNRLYNINIKQ